MLSFNAFAKVSWELGWKLGIEGSYSNKELISTKTEYLDLFSFSGPDVTFCFNKFIGLNISICTMMPITYINMVNGEPVQRDAKNTDSPMDNVLGDLSLVLMLPFTEKFKLKTELGYGFNTYSRGTTIVDKENYYSSSTEKVSFNGFTASLGAVITPIKHLCIGFGVEGSYASAEGYYSLSNSGYTTTFPYYNIIARPYVTVAARLGKNL